jgi:hypothetical protein
MDEQRKPLDDALGALYRALPREEPPPAIDAAVLAAARRSTASRPTRRWAAPAALAAVLVLSVGVTLRVAEERPDAQLQPALPAPPAPVAAVPAEKVAEAPAAQVPDTSPRKDSPAHKAQPPARPQAVAPAAERRAPTPPQTARTEDRVAAQAPADPPIKFVPSPRADSAPPPPALPVPDPAAQSAPSERPAVRAEARPAAPAMAPAAGASDARMQRLSKSASAESSLGSTAAQTPEAWLERIAQMRAQGRHKEADESFAEFRRQHPAYAIAPQMLEKIAPSR